MGSGLVSFQIQLDVPNKKLESSDSVISMKQLNVSHFKKTVVNVPMETCSISTKTPPKPEYQVGNVILSYEIKVNLVATEKLSLLTVLNHD